MRRPLRITLVVGAIGLVAAAVTAAALGLGGGSAGSATAAYTPSLTTTPVTLATLTRTEQVTGTLDYGTPITVNGRGSGVVTWLPIPGAVIARGGTVYRADDRPITLFYGTLPLYRALHVGDAGPDADEVAHNLAALGYRGFAVTSHYTSAVAAAVRDWQLKAGFAGTGIFDPACVVVAAAEIRITKLFTHLGDEVGTAPTLTYTGNTRSVHVDLDVALQGLVAPGAAATVTLPNGASLDGTVTAVGVVASPGATPTEPATIEVQVTVTDHQKLGVYDKAPVAVQLVAARVSNVLTVPVAALVALNTGGYGLQVVTGSTSRYVAVQLGMFANGRVQVTGDGIAAGTLVGVAS